MTKGKIMTVVFTSIFETSPGPPRNIQVRVWFRPQYLHSWPNLHQRDPRNRLMFLSSRILYSEESNPACYLFCLILFFVLFYSFLRLYPPHMEVPRLGLKLQLLAYATATATATPDPSLACNLCPSVQQHWILNPLSEARDQNSHPH